MKLVYDRRRKQPAGILVQSSQRCDIEALMAFDVGCWLRERTPDMEILELDAAGLRKLVEETPNAKVQDGSWGPTITRRP